jgi:hypothetical protein
MPGFDRTGPRGEGPMTGRGLGPCGRGRGFRRGFGRGAGFGRGFSRGRGYAYDYAPVAPALTKDQEKAVLEDEMKILQEDMEAIKKRLKELK